MKTAVYFLKMKIFFSLEKFKKPTIEENEVAMQLLVDNHAQN